MVRFAILGCGRISEVHGKAIHDAENAELVAVCDIIEEKAKKRAEEYGVPYYTDLEQMLKEAKPQVVTIGTPSGMHSDHVQICARYGVNVLCEKPLDITSEAIDRMIAACEENNVLLGGIFQRRAYSAALVTEEALKEGKIGKRLISDAFLKYHRSQEYYDSDEWRGTWALDGGGALMNQGIHGVDLLQWLGGGVKSVTAHCETLARNIEVEDTAVVILRFNNGAVGVLECATSLIEGEETVLSFYGDEGAISFADHSFLQWKCKDGSTAPDVKDSLGGVNCGWTDVWDGHRMLVEDMARCVEEGGTPMIPAKEARKAVDIILAIYESAKTGKEVFLK